LFLNPFRERASGKNLSLQKPAHSKKIFFPFSANRLSLQVFFLSLCFSQVKPFPSLGLGSASPKGFNPSKSSRGSFKKKTFLWRRFALVEKKFSNFSGSAAFHWQTKVSNRGSPFGSGFSFDQLLRGMKR